MISFTLDEVTDLVETNRSLTDRLECAESIIAAANARADEATARAASAIASVEDLSVSLDMAAAYVAALEAENKELKRQLANRNPSTAQAEPGMSVMRAIRATRAPINVFDEVRHQQRLVS